jgi:hypothetical protein
LVKARADCSRAAGPFESEVPTVPNGTQRVGVDVDAAQAACAVLAGSSVAVSRAIVMGLDQHRAQITAEWIDTADRRDRPRADRARAPRGRATVPAPL